MLLGKCMSAEEKWMSPELWQAQGLIHGPMDRYSCAQLRRPPEEVLLQAVTLKVLLALSVSRVRFSSRTTSAHHMSETRVCYALHERESKCSGVTPLTLLRSKRASVIFDNNESPPQRGKHPSGPRRAQALLVGRLQSLLLPSLSFRRTCQLHFL